ncbi:TPA: type 1 fimbrial protein [Klebsiella aerogenes]|nr:type 1 fimbrial protein [Klebsiella aerogenes]
MLFCLLASFVVQGALAQPQEHGRVSLRGSIIETPCAIDTQSRDQTVDMGATPVGVIARDGHGAARSFSIRLVNCHLERSDKGQADWRYFRATFDGPSENGQFGLHGGARGVSLQLADRDGNIASPGEPLPPGRLISGNQELDYTLRLVGDRQSLLAGDFHTILRFRMDYY